MTATENQRPITPGSTSTVRPTRLPQVSILARGLAIFALIASALWAVSLVTAQEESTPSSTPAGTPEATPSAQMPRLELELEELNDSGIQGTVTLYEFGDRTIVEFDVDGAGGGHPANISAGVCGDLDPEPAHNLKAIDDEGQSLTVVDVRLEELLNSPHAIDMRLASDQLGTLIACANIEGQPEVPTEGTPQSTPEVTPTGEGGQVVPTSTQTPTSTVTATATATSTVTATATATTTAATATATPPDATAQSTPEDGTGGAISGDEPTATIALQELNDSGVSGTVVLTGQGAATKVSILLSGVVTGGHIAHLHDGTCAAPGEYTYTLTPISAEGTSETIVNLTIEQLLGGNYMINVHPSEDNWDAWMVCGELVATGGTVATATVAPTSTPTTSGGQQPTTGTIPVTVVPGTSTTTTATTTPIVSGKGASMIGDGTSGVTGGTTAPGTVGTLPQTAGVGAMLQWPSDPRTAILWAATGAAVILLVAALVIRRGERETSTTHSRWTRLGI
jgi:hypothetical protein